MSIPLGVCPIFFDKLTRRGWQPPITPRNETPHLISIASAGASKKGRKLTIWREIRHVVLVIATCCNPSKAKNVLCSVKIIYIIDNAYNNVYILNYIHIYMYNPSPPDLSRFAQWNRQSPRNDWFVSHQTLSSVYLPLGLWGRQTHGESPIVSSPTHQNTAGIMSMPLHAFRAKRKLEA